MLLRREKVFSLEILPFTIVFGRLKSSRNVSKQQASPFPIWIVYATPKVKTVFQPHFNPEL